MISGGPGNFQSRASVGSTQMCSLDSESNTSASLGIFVLLEKRGRNRHRHCPVHHHSLILFPLVL